MTTIEEGNDLTVEEVAKLFGVLPQTIYNWTCTIPAFPRPCGRRGRKVTWAREDVEAYKTATGRGVRAENAERLKLLAPRKKSKR